MALKDEGKSVIDYADGEKRDVDAIIDIECDIWIPAARPDVIHEDNVQRLNAKMVIEGANIPITHGAEKILHEKGILYVPDFIANAGGVICAAMEYQGASQAAAFATIEEKLRRNTQETLETARREQILPREAAMRMARKRIDRAMSFRRWNLF
jgi:glutamate dehydrogenase (NAD(P)+)